MKDQDKTQEELIKELVWMRERIAALEQSLVTHKQQQRLDDARTKAHDDLEARLRERTAELAAMNEALRREVAERERVEKVLQLEREQLLSIFDSISERISVIDAETYEIVYVNKFMQDLYAKDRIGGLCYKELHGLDSPCGHCTKEMAMSPGGEFYRSDYHNPTTNKDYLATERIIRWSEGRDLKFHLCIDVTERRKAEEALRESEERFRRLFEDAPLMYVVTRNERGVPYISDCNQFFLRSVGYSLEEVVGRPLEDFYSPESIAELMEGGGYKRGLEGEFIIGERQLLTRNGTLIPTLLYATPEKDSSGQVTGTRAMFVDITDRKRAEEALRESEERFRRIFEQGPLGLAIVSLDYRWLAVNGALCQMLEYSEDDLAGLTFVNITHPDDLDENLEYAEKLARGEIPFYRMEKRYIKKSGEVFWINVTGSVVRDDHGKALYFLSMIEDISDRKRAEDLALQTARFKSVADLSTGVAHHFNNLLQIVIGNTSLSLTDLESGDLSELKINLEQILQAAALGSETVKRLQTFGNIRPDIPIQKAAIFDISTTVRNAAELSEPLWKSDIEKKGISIDMDLDLEDGCLVKGQENEMLEVLVNLTRNAAQALPEGGSIILKTLKEIDEVVVTIRDTGTGIAEDDLPKIFQPFWSTKGVGIGKGMGLAVCHGLVKRHGGGISVQSKVGLGTTFTIRLPLAREQVAKMAEPIARSAEGKPTILVIDDDQNVATLLERIFAKAGHTVFKALSGEEGLSIFNEQSANVVICDLGMPALNGWDVGKAIRLICMEREITKPAFVLLTGWGGQELEKEKISESGVDAVIAKPIDSCTVISTIREITGRGGIT